MKTLSLTLRTFLLLFVITAFSRSQNVVMNEIFSRGVAGDVDWIEVYNPQSVPVDISGYKIYDSGAKGGTKSKKLFPAGTILPAKGFTAILVDTATFVGDTSAFGLSNNGETVWFENAAGVLIDTCAFPALGVDTTYARVPDGSKLWTKVTPRTKGNSNVFIKMNEIFTRGTAGNLDWVEIYNSSASSVDISGYKIYDNGGQGGTKSKKLFPAGTVVPSNGFTVIIVDTATFVGDTSGFGLSNSGENIWLENAAGLVIDTVAIPALGADTSYARVPDGSNVMLKRSPLTRGATNGSLLIVCYPTDVPSAFELLQNYPNPFNPSTTIAFSIPSDAHVSLRIFNVIGQEVAQLVNGDVVGGGVYEVRFDGSRLASGLYIARLESGGKTQLRKMLMMK